MSPQEFAQWKAWDRIEPFGEAREDLRHGIRSALMANLWGGKRKQYKPEDFIPKFERKQRKTRKQMEHWLLMFKQLHNQSLAAKGGNKPSPT